MPARRRAWREQAAAADGPARSSSSAGRGELVLDPFAGVGGTLLGRAICARPATGASASSSTRAGRRSTTRSCATCRPSATARARCWPTSARRTRADRGAFDPSGARAAGRRRARASCRRCRTGSIDFVATDPPLQPPAADDDGRRRLAETHANRRTDYAMVTDLDARPRQRRRLPGVPRPDGGTSSAELRAGAARRSLRASSSSATPTRMVGTCSRAPTSPRGRDAAGSCPKGDLIWYQAGTRLRPYGYPRAFVPNIVHQHILVLRKETRRVESARRRDSR